MCSIEYVRRLGNLPREIKDEVIEPHLQAAERRVREVVGNWNPGNDHENGLYCEAIGCFTMALLIPSVQTLFIEGAKRVQKMVAEVDLIFDTPEDMEKRIQGWERRGWEALRGLGFKKMSVEVV